MKKKYIILLSLALSVAMNLPVHSAIVLKNKEEAAMFKKDNIYAEIGVQEQVVVKDQNIEDGYVGLRDNDAAINKFTAVTATKNGSTYVNTWSNYKISFQDQFYNANDVYDFNGDGIKYDFGIYFDDYSRIAIYYSRLSRDMNIVLANFAPKAVPDEAEIAGAIYRHVSLDVPYPYGTERYNYYLREIDGKLMVIETFHEDNYDKCRKYIDKFEKAH